MAVNAFLPSKTVTTLGKRACQMKLPRQIPWGDKLSTLPGGSTLICAVNAAMSMESVRRSRRATVAPVTNET